MRTNEDIIKRAESKGYTLCQKGFDGMMFAKQKEQISVICSWAAGWEHVSINRWDRDSTWKEMCELKEIFWKDDEAVMQIHPPKSEYVDNLEHCLHLWRPIKKYSGTIPLPDSLLVGIKGLKFERKEMIKLSIIIPAYNAEPYIYELIKRLRPQLTEEVEVIVVDDGSKKPVMEMNNIRVIRQENKGASAARNTGIDNAKGEYIAFIDADDLVSKEYVSKILDKIETEHFDYCYISWKTIGNGWQYEVRLNSVEDKFPPFNLCVWNRIYRKDMIGDVRFNEKKPIAEDAEFIRAVKEEGKKKAYISDFMYYYRADTPNSLTKRYSKGEFDFERLVYYFKHVEKDDRWIIDDIKAEDPSDKEIIVMTEQNDIPELTEYAMVTRPTQIIANRAKGEVGWKKWVMIRPMPIRTQVVMYIGNAHPIGGVETFIYNFCKEMCELYDIIVVYSEHMDAMQIARLSEFVQVMRNPVNKGIICDTLISNRITDDVPDNIKYKKKVQMCHTCQMRENYQIKRGWDDIVFVSKVAADSFRDQAPEYKVIHNMLSTEKPKKTLLLISAQRMTYEKGEQRIIDLAESFVRKGIPFLWIIFTRSRLSRHVPGVVVADPTLNAKDFFKRADYIVCLSDIEAYGYTLAEAMQLGVPVLTTPIGVLDEIGFKDGENGYIVPFNIEEADVEKYYKKIPKVKAVKKSNDEIKQQWQQLLGDTTPKHTYKPYGDTVRVVITEDYGDIELGRNMRAGEVVTMRKERALLLISLHKAEVV